MHNRIANQTASSKIVIEAPLVLFNLYSTTLYDAPATPYVPIGDIIWYVALLLHECHELTLNLFSLRVQIRVPRGMTPAATISINVAPVAKLLALNGTIIRIPSNIASTLASVGTSGVLSDTDGDADGYVVVVCCVIAKLTEKYRYDDTVTFAFGEITNVPAGDDIILIEIYASVMEMTANVNMAPLSNTATLKYSTPQLTINTPLQLYVGEPILNQMYVNHLFFSFSILTKL